MVHLVALYINKWKINRLSHLPIIERQRSYNTKLKNYILWPACGHLARAYFVPIHWKALGWIPPYSPLTWSVTTWKRCRRVTLINSFWLLQPTRWAHVLTYWECAGMSLYCRHSRLSLDGNGTPAWTRQDILSQLINFSTTLFSSRREINKLT